MALGPIDDSLRGRARAAVIVRADVGDDCYFLAGAARALRRPPAGQPTSAGWTRNSAVAQNCSGQIRRQVQYPPRYVTHKHRPAPARC